jgi:hypothetical protein
MKQPLARLQRKPDLVRVADIGAQKSKKMPDYSRRMIAWSPLGETNNLAEPARRSENEASSFSLTLHSIRRQGHRTNRCENDPVKFQNAIKVAVKELSR